jgi:ATPase family associated with various cellular activities (AAA)
VTVTAAAWERRNHERLAVALADLRSRLKRYAEGDTSGDPGGDERQPHGSQGEVPPALAQLGELLGLSVFEQEVLLLCAAPALDPSIAALCALAQADPALAYPTFALALSLFDNPHWDVLSPERPLRHWRLVEIDQPPGRPLTTSPLRADERIVNYLKGLNYLDDRLAPLLLPVYADDPEDGLSGTQLAAAEATLALLARPGLPRRPVLQLLGPEEPGKLLVAERVAAAAGLRLYHLHAASLPTSAAELDLLARLWRRESLLLPVALYLDAHEAAVEADGSERPGGYAMLADSFLVRTDGVLFLGTRDASRRLGRWAVPVDVPRPTALEQRAAWAAMGAPIDLAVKLSSQFDLPLPAIRNLARAALDGGASPAADGGERLWHACLAATRLRLDTLAQRLETGVTWDDLVLPAAELALLRQVTAQVAHRGIVYDDWGFRSPAARGLGVTALFAGQSGTGKTLAAEVLASELRLALYRVDLAGVVSKYIGETEKNLARLFDAAEAGGAILFFDEADALFGKRSEVRDSHDRYANVEINYLLQRMETFQGLAILASNLHGALDRAFLRRLRFVVRFPFPGEAERRQIWARAFPTGTPTGGLDLARLAKLHLAGGDIHNIAVAAAFLAANAGTPVTMPLVLDAARTEFRKLDRPVDERDFTWQPPQPAAPARVGAGGRP